MEFDNIKEFLVSADNGSDLTIIMPTPDTLDALSLAFKSYSVDKVANLVHLKSFRVSTAMIVSLLLEQLKHQ